MKRKFLKLGLAGIAGLTLCGGLLTLNGRHDPARADATNYTNQKRTIRACVLVTEAGQDANGGGSIYPSNVTPHVFYALDSRTDLKPGNFIFENPLAPEIVTQDIYNRWLNRSQANGNKDRAFTNGTSEQQLFQVGAPCTKNIAAHWEVNLSKVTAQDLQQFDVVLMPLHGSRGNLGVQFTPAERERLRHYVDQGGTIWLENEGVGNNAFGAGNFFTLLNTGNPPGANTPISVAAAHHPLLNYPYLISAQNAYGLSVQNGMNGNLFVDAGSASTQNSIGGGLLRLSQFAAPILRKNGQTTVFAGDYGAGHVLVTSANIAGDINNYMLSGNGAGTAGSSVIGRNDGAVSGSNLEGIPPVDLKFAYNLASWISSVPAPGSNQRRTGATQENIGSSLAVKWSPLPLTNPVNVGSGATIYKGLTFWVDGNNNLHAFDVNPQQSLSGTSNPDDGIPDLIYGFPYDEVWNDITSGRVLPAAGSTRGSTPTVVTVTDPGTQTIAEALALQATDGSFYIVPMAFGGLQMGSKITVKRETGDMLPSLATTTPAAGAMPSSSAGGPFGNPFPKPVPAPAYSEGVLFGLTFSKAKGMNGELGWRVEAIDLLQSIRNGSAVSVFGNTDGSDAVPNPNAGGMGLPGFFNPQGSLTVGEVKDPSTDAVDKIVYVPCAANDSAHTSGVVHGVWYSTRAERLRLLGQTRQTTIFPAGRTFLPSGLRSRIPWFVNGAPASINLNPVVNIVAYNTVSGAVTGIRTLNYPADFTVVYAPDGEYTPTDPNDLNSTPIYSDPAPPAARSHVILNTAPAGNEVVYVDYTVDWPGAPINGNSPAPTDLAFLYLRQYQTSPASTMNTMTPEFSGGVALSGDDNLLMAETNLRVSGNFDSPLPDRLMSVRDSFIGTDSATVPGNNLARVGAQGRRRRAGPYVNWMFSPNENVTLDNNYAGGVFNGYQLRPRLFFTDPVSKAQSPIYDFKTIGSPVSSNGTVYVLGIGYRTPQSAGGAGTPPAPDYTVMLALRENVDATMDIGPITETGTVQLIQPSFINPGQAITLNPDTDAAEADFSLERVQDPINGGYKGVVHIHNFQQTSGSADTFNLALPIWVQASQAANQPAVGGIPRVNPVTGVGILDNLQYYVVIPAQNNASLPNVPPVIATSGPSVSGDTLYFAADESNRFTGGKAISGVVTVDLVRAVNSQNGNPIDAKGVPIVAITPALTDVTTGGPLATTYPSIHPPLGTTNVMIATNGQSLTGMDNGLVLIADSHRLLEVDAGGNAYWSMEATRTHVLIGNNNLADGGVASTPISLSRPATARRFELNDFLIVDTGNSRIVGADRGSTTRFEISGFQDGMRFLRPGDSLTLNQPTDMETFPEAFTTGYSVTNRDTGVTYSYNGAGTAYHYLIADSGNYRILDLVDVYDANGQLVNLTPSDSSPNILGEKVLAFVSRSLGEQNQRYRYRTVQQFRILQNGVPVDYIIATVANVRQADTGGVGIVGNDSTNFEGPGGSLMVIQRSASGPNPTAGGPNLAAGDVYNVINSFRVADATGNFTQRQKVSNPTWFKEFSVADTTQGLGNNPQQVPRFLLSDANGCYILRYDNVLKDYVTDWKLTATEYYYLTGRKLQATSIVRETLADYSQNRNKFEARLLITNGYSGTDNMPAVFGAGWAQGVVQGEVFEINAAQYYPMAGKPNFGYAVGPYRRYGVNAGNPVINTLGPITRMIPNENAVKTGGGQYVIKRSIGSPDNGLSTFILEQPQYAEKPL